MKSATCVVAGPEKPSSRVPPHRLHLDLGHFHLTLPSIDPVVLIPQMAVRAQITRARVSLKRLRPRRPRAQLAQPAARFVARHLLVRDRLQVLADPEAAGVFGCFARGQDVVRADALPGVSIGMGGGGCSGCSFPSIDRQEVWEFISPCRHSSRTYLRPERWRRSSSSSAAPPSASASGSAHARSRTRPQERTPRPDPPRQPPRQSSSSSCPPAPSSADSAGAAPHAASSASPPPRYS